MGGVAGDPRSDAELLEDAARGDEGAMGELYLRHREWCYRLALRYAGGPEAAADAVQESFAWVLSKLGRLRLKGKMTTLLYPVVKHSALAAKRKRAARTGVELPEVECAPEVVGEAAMVRDAVERLPEAQREALLMRVIDAMTVPEIATALDVPEGTIKSRLHHALRVLKDDPRLRELMED